MKTSIQMKVFFLVVQLGLSYSFTIDFNEIIIRKNSLIKFNNNYFVAVPKDFENELEVWATNINYRVLNLNLLKRYIDPVIQTINDDDNSKPFESYLLDGEEKNEADNNISLEITSQNDSKVEKFNELKNEDSMDIYIKVGIIGALTIFSGIMSGLTVGYLSIDDLELELKSISGSQKDKINANKVLPILAKRHWLLVTLLLMNAGAMEALPIFLDDLVPEYLAVIISVTLVLLFGEILPQALCTGPNQIKIAAFLSPFTKLLMYITSPISFPIGKMLDWCFGEHTKSRFLNTELKTLIELHTHNALEKLQNRETPDTQNGQLSDHNKSTDKSDNIGLAEEQANLMISAIEIRKKSASELLIPYSSTFTLEYETPIGENEIKEILSKGFSRIPVYSGANKHNLLGLLRIKQLVGKDFLVPKSLKDLELDLKEPLVISPSLKIIDLLREFLKGKSHMAVVTLEFEALQKKLSLSRMNSVKLREQAPPVFERQASWEEDAIHIEGIITLEDVIENMINLQILDEDDYDKLVAFRVSNSKRKSVRQTIGNAIHRRLDSKNLVKNFIHEESDRLQSLISESYNRKSYKEYLLSKEPNLSPNFFEERQQSLIRRDDNEKI